MALATDVRQYVPPKRIQQMESDLCALSEVWDNTPLAGPWGWSMTTKQRYKQMGFPQDSLPSDEWIQEVRRLSSRKYACEYIREMLREVDDDLLLGQEMLWREELTLKEKPPRIFKLPWSSSGRGVFVAKEYDEHVEKRLRGFITSQGGYVEDCFYEDKMVDFAMEFLIHKDHQVEFLGYSVFHAETTGTYGYNYVESQEELKHRIGVDEKLLDRLVTFHQQRLAEISYTGPVGIDMLKTADGHVHPCLEINLRMNMGILALILHEKYGTGCTQQLTPMRKQGFEAKVDKGKLMIVYH